jgi:hypothetical protein
VAEQRYQAVLAVISDVEGRAAAPLSMTSSMRAWSAPRGQAFPQCRQIVAAVIDPGDVAVGPDQHRRRTRHTPFPGDLPAFGEAARRHGIDSAGLGGLDL